MKDDKGRTMIDEAVFCDLETGGTRREHPIIQIGAVVVDLNGWKLKETFERKLRFDSAICDHEALVMNSWEPQFWHEQAVDPADAKADFEDFLKRHQTLELMSKGSAARRPRPYRLAKIGGHNFAKFDGRKLLSLWGEDFPPFCHWRPLDTLTLAGWCFSIFGSGSTKKVDPPNHRLGTLAEWFGIDEGQAHDALADAKTCALVARALLIEIRERLDIAGDEVLG